VGALGEEGLDVRLGFPAGPEDVFQLFRGASWEWVKRPEVECPGKSRRFIREPRRDWERREDRWGLEAADCQERCRGSALLEKELLCSERGFPEDNFVPGAGRCPRGVGCVGEFGFNAVDEVGAPGEAIEGEGSIRGGWVGFRESRQEFRRGEKEASAQEPGRS